MPPSVEQFPIMLPLLRGMLLLIGIAVLSIPGADLWQRIAARRGRRGAPARLPRARARYGTRFRE